MIADMHCDTLSEIRHERAKGHNAGLRDAEGLRINLEKLREGGYAVQNFAVFIHTGRGRDPYEDAMELVQIFESEMQLNSDLISQVTTAEEIEENYKAGRLSAMLTLEEGAMCEGEVEKLEEFYRHGARMMTLTWNFENELATPATPEIKGKSSPDFIPADPSLPGLKKKGFMMVEAMESLGMIPDVSHLSDAGFYDICDICHKPFVASHSNARAICGQGRNLSDDMIRKLGEHGGVAGLNYFPLFISDKPDKVSLPEMLARHARHMANCGGIGCVGLGSDFDGFGGPSFPDSASDADDLTWAFHKAGFSDSEIDSIMYGNVMRVYRETLK